MSNDRRRCARCRSPLASDNKAMHCAPCDATVDGLRRRPPDVPLDFWLHPTIRAAAFRRHMGRLIAAYRRHPHHGIPISQEIVGAWVGVTQGQISRMENGQPEQNIDRLIQWARLLVIPGDVLWFACPTPDTSIATTATVGDGLPGQVVLFPPPPAGREIPPEPVLLPSKDAGKADDAASERTHAWTSAPADLSVPEFDLVEFAAALEHRGISNHELTAAEVACERLDQEFARTPPDEVLRVVRLLMKHVAAQVVQPQTLRHHERLVQLSARLAGLRAWACFDVDDHRQAEQWYRAAVSAAQEAKAWGLGAWLLGAQSLIPWHRRDFSNTVELIERGIYFASQGTDATTRAWLHALHARAYAGMGNADGFDDAYAAAEATAEYSNERDRRHGMDFTHGILDLRYYCGTSRLLLGQPQLAHSELTGSRDGLPQSHTKARAVLDLFLADAAAQSDEATQAVDLARGALLSTMHQPILPILQQSRRVHRLVRRKAPADAELLRETVEDFSNALAATAAKVNA